MKLITENKHHYHILKIITLERGLFFYNYNSIDYYICLISQIVRKRLEGIFRRVDEATCPQCLQKINYSKTRKLRAFEQ